LHQTSNKCTNQTNIIAPFALQKIIQIYAIGFSRQPSYL